MGGVSIGCPFVIFLTLFIMSGVKKYITMLMYMLIAKSKIL
jgi:hypothetical protein